LRRAVELGVNRTNGQTDDVSFIGGLGVIHSPMVGTAGPAAPARAEADSAVEAARAQAAAVEEADTRAETAAMAAPSSGRARAEPRTMRGRIRSFLWIPRWRTGR
jgi:hypothetical protein